MARFRSRLNTRFDNFKRAGKEGAQRRVLQATALQTGCIHTTSSSTSNPLAYRQQALKQQCSS